MNEVAPALKGTDISVEFFRTYVYDKGATYTITNPKTLFITDTGSHRVVDKSGLTHYPRNDWVGLQWKQTDGKPFAF